MSTPKGSQKKTPNTASTKGKQASILGFFQKKTETGALPARPALGKQAPAVRSNITPAPSSDPVEPPSSAIKPRVGSILAGAVKTSGNKENGLISPVTTADLGPSTDAGAEPTDDDDASPVRRVSNVS
jgi:hypothetical protein